MSLSPSSPVLLSPPPQQQDHPQINGPREPLVAGPFTLGPHLTPAMPAAQRNTQTHQPHPAPLPTSWFISPPPPPPPPLAETSIS
ncbi:hypothetical protein O3P69_020712 [Scylla paramamosain]|uniref:Uncharacterized protein n=1 Tax=Scylla paramamosain TaxID=85552 RepID=A0AAW0TMJ4_SCYPA